MHKFKPTMKNGMGQLMPLAPEAHAEWSDKEGKHAAVPVKHAGVDGSHLVPKKHVGPDGFEPEGASKQGSTKHHEKMQIAKGAHSPASQGLFAGSAGKGKSGFPISVKAHAGKGGSGSVKEHMGKGKLNKGNGLKKGGK